MYDSYDVIHILQISWGEKKKKAKPYVTKNHYKYTKTFKNNFFLLRSLENKPKTKSRGGGYWYCLEFCKSSWTFKKNNCVSYFEN